MAFQFGPMQDVILDPFVTVTSNTTGFTIQKNAINGYYKGILFVNPGPSSYQIQVEVNQTDYQGNSNDTSNIFYYNSTFGPAFNIPVDGYMGNLTITGTCINSSTISATPTIQLFKCPSTFDLRPYYKNVQYVAVNDSTPQSDWAYSLANSSKKDTDILSLNRDTLMSMNQVQADSYGTVSGSSGSFTLPGITDYFVMTPKIRQAICEDDTVIVEGSFLYNGTAPTMNVDVAGYTFSFTQTGGFTAAQNMNKILGSITITSIGSDTSGTVSVTIFGITKNVSYTGLTSGSTISRATSVISNLLRAAYLPNGIAVSYVYNTIYFRVINEAVTYTNYTTLSATFPSGFTSTTSMTSAAQSKTLLGTFPGTNLQGPADSSSTLISRSFALVVKRKVLSVYIGINSDNMINAGSLIVNAGNFYDYKQLFSVYFGNANASSLTIYPGNFTLSVLSQKNNTLDASLVQISPNFIRNTMYNASGVISGGQFCVPLVNKVQGNCMPAMYTFGMPYQLDFVLSSNVPDTSQGFSIDNNLYSVSSFVPILSLGNTCSRDVMNVRLTSYDSYCTLASPMIGGTVMYYYSVDRKK